MSMTTIEQFPIFLRSYGNLTDHLNSQLDGLNSNEKGGIFARFTSKIIPLTDVGIKAEFDADDIKNPSAQSLLQLGKVVTRQAQKAEKRIAVLDRVA